MNYPIEIQPGDWAESLAMEDCRIGHPEWHRLGEDVRSVGRVFLILAVRTGAYLAEPGRPTATVLGARFNCYCAGCFRKVESDAFEEPRKTDVRIPENVG